MRNRTLVALLAAGTLGLSSVASAQSPGTPPPPPQYPVPPPENIPPPPPDAPPPAPAPSASYVPQRWQPPPPVEIDDWSVGDPIPAGYHAVSRRHKGLIVAGIITFGAAYTTSLLVAAADDTTNGDTTTTPTPALLIPVVGPFIQLGLGTDDVDQGFLVLDGLAQLSGVGMFVAGMLWPSHFLLRNDFADDGSSIVIGPLLAQRASGLAVSGHF